MKIPSVLDVLTDQEIQKATFLIPRVGREILLLNSVGEETFPKSIIMARTLLTLSANTVVPFHAHKNKEKIYICQGPVCPKVMLVINGAIVDFTLKSGNQLVIPAGCPHCVRHFSATELLSCRIIVITSSQDSSDIAWEDGVEELVKNHKH
jgi:uncharacterized RmlC-like cupin family protein